MLENLRRKSLVKTYNDLIQQVYFEQGLARYRNHVEIDVCNQRLSKELQKIPFKKTIDTISIDTRVWLRFNMIYCPKGTFIMGHEDENDNKPRLETIERSFLLGETEITQELYEKVMGKNPSKFKNRPKNPVEQVSWDDAILFCNELSRLQGLDECYTKKSRKKFDWLCDFGKNGYRLPKEKEWEYAAKAGTQNKWAGTNKEEELGKYVWFGEDLDIGSTHPVATKLPNEWGFYDMSGNVFEWCWDKHWDLGFQSHPTAERVTRGDSCYTSDSRFISGHWIRVPRGVRSSAYRREGSPGDRRVDLGFRVCRSIDN